MDAKGLMMNKILLASLLGTTIVALSACGTPQPTTYYWGNYQNTVYEHFQQAKTSPDEQIASTQKIISEADGRALMVAPGIHAHLGMLYAQTGRLAEAKSEFETEKQLFPESAPFMSFLLKQSKGAK